MLGKLHAMTRARRVSFIRWTAFGNSENSLLQIWVCGETAKEQRDTATKMLFYRCDEDRPITPRSQRDWEPRL